MHRDIKKAMMLSTVPGSGSVAEKFKRIKDAGFDGVEPRGGMNRDDVLRVRDDSGLHIPSVSCATNWTKPLTDADPAVRAEGLAGLKTALNDAKVYGASSVLLVSGVVNERIAYDEAYTRSQAEIRKAVPLAEKLGVKIAIETVFAVGASSDSGFASIILSSRVGSEFLRLLIRNAARVIGAEDLKTRDTSTGL
jgi:L-ribulose-5-phosphate 3-epimerase